MCLCVSNQRQRRLSWRKVMGYELGSRAEHSVLCQLTQRHIAHIGVHYPCGGCKTMYPICLCISNQRQLQGVFFSNPFNQKPLNYVPMCFPKSNETPHATPPKTPATPSQSTGCGASPGAATPARSASRPASYRY